MRIIGLGLLAFLLTGTTLALSQSEFVKNGFDAFKDKRRNTQLIFEPDTSDVKTTKGERVAFLRSDASAPLILSGLPAFGSARFSLPISAQAQSGYLQLETTMQSLAGVEGVLRVSIDNTRRGEILLVPGLVSRSVKFPLSSKDLSKESLIVSLSLVGAGPSAGCSNEDHLATIAEIEPSTVMVLTFDTPLQTTEDQISAWGDDLRIEWPQDQNAQSRADIIAKAAMLQRQGYAVSFHDKDGLDAASLSSLLTSVNQRATAPQIVRDYPLALTEFSGNAGTRDFKHRTTWRTRYNLEQATDSEIPGHLNVDLNLGPLPAENQWSVSAKLNGHLLIADMLEAGTRDFTTRLELPAAYQGTSNLIEISATSGQELEGECNNGPDLIAELTENSFLLGSGQKLTGPLSDLRAALAQQAMLSVQATDALCAANAEAFAALIAGVISDTVTVQGDVETDDIVLLTRADTAALSDSGQADQTDWVVFMDEAVGALQAVQGSPDVLENFSQRAPLALLIRAPK